MPGKYYTLRRNSSNCHIFEFNPSELRFDSTIGIRGKLERLSKIQGEPAQNEIPYAKLNGGFFAMNGSTEYIGTYVDDGLYYNAPNSTYPTLIFWKDSKKMDYCLEPTTAQLVEYQNKAQFAIGVPWMLVIDGKRNYIYTKAQLNKWFGHPSSRAPRTLVGQKNDGTIVWVAVDGRKTSTLGFNIDHSANLMLELGCRIAANLDGGGSTEMIVNGKIVNTLSDGAERAIGTALIAYQKTNTQPLVVENMNTTGKVNTTALNVRSAPNTAAIVLDCFRQGTVVDIVGYSSGWYKIKYGTNGFAWVSAQYVIIASDSGKATGVTIAALNMRTGPSTSYSKILTIPINTTLTLDGSTNGWYKVTYSSRTGWCSGQYIKL